MNAKRYDIAVCGSGVWRRRDSFRDATAQCQPAGCGRFDCRRNRDHLGPPRYYGAIFVVVAMSHGLAVLWTLGGFMLARSATVVRLVKAEA